MADNSSSSSSNNSTPTATIPENASSHSGHQLRCDEAAQFDHNKLTVDKDCTECSVCRPDPTASQLVMFLHALSYKVTIVTA